MAYFRTLLNDTLRERVRQNPRYSLRAFALSLGVDPGNLSRAMRGLSVLSWDYGQRIVKALNLNPEQSKAFFDSLESSAPRGVAGTNQRRSKALETPQIVDLNSFELVSDHLHYAISELTAVEDFQPDPSWIADALGTSPAKAEAAIERLKRVGILREEGGRLVKAAPKMQTGDAVHTNEALKQYLKEVMELGMRSIDKDPIQERCHMALTMPIDPDLLDKARASIVEFAKKLCTELSSGRRRQVYQLGLALYPLQRKPPA